MMQWLRDLWLEYRIGAAYHEWVFARPQDQRKLLERMDRLIGERSPRQVAKMERAKGLA